MSKKILFIISTSDFYEYYNSLNIALSLSACDKKVYAFYTGYACNFLTNNWKNYDKKKLNPRIEKLNMIKYYELLELCIQSGIKFSICNTAKDFLEIKDSEILKLIKNEKVSMYTIINEHKDSQIIFI